MQMSMKNNIQTLFLELANYLNKVLVKIYENQKNEISHHIKEVQLYINKNYALNITLDKISAIAGFNATYFSTLFKKETGIGFLEYITNIRINAAKHLLGDLNKSILEICYDVGYSDLKHFTKQFKKLTKLTPSEYRKFHYRG